MILPLVNTGAKYTALTSMQIQGNKYEFFELIAVVRQWVSPTLRSTLKQAWVEDPRYLQAGWESDLVEYFPELSEDTTLVRKRLIWC